MEQNNTWIHMVVLTAMVVSGVLKPANILTVILEVVRGRSDQQVNPILRDQLNMETKYSSSTNMGQNHTWTHVAILLVVVVGILFKLALVLTVIMEAVHGRSNLQVESTLAD